MKPIELTVAGLHSFREKQTIDFTRLVDGGVFGIFGPTGSGKSSLLDAMTLALYGKVERASGNTQGILNHAEEEVAVSFTFDLGTRQPKRYRVERVYKRTKTDGLAIGSCRLHFLSENGHEVLADKEREVTQEIRNLLGLTHDDFTRAVVLPQGKFADFLSLKGAERRRMLQRLFHLEKYGDLLNEKIRGRAQTVERRLEAITAEQNGLGDASKEALEASYEQYKQAEKQAKAYNDQLKKDKERLEKVKTEWHNQQELEEYERQEKLLLNEQETIAQHRDQVKKAQLASKVMPYVKEHEGALEKVEDAKRRLKEFHQQYEAVQSQEVKALQQYQQAKEAIDKRMPTYEQEKAAFLHAGQLQEELSEKQQREAVLRQSEEKQSKAIIESRKQQEQMEVDYKEKKKRLQQKMQERQSLSISSDYRETVRKALTGKQEIVNEMKALKDWQGHLQQTEEKLEALTGEYHRNMTILEKVKEQLKQGFSHYEKIYHRLSQIVSQSRILKDWLDVQEEERQKKYQQVYQKTLAEQLRKQLTEGMPCPVCGATHHSHSHEPAEVGPSLEAFEGLKDFYKKCMEWVQSALQSTGSQQVALENRVQQIETLEEGLVPGIRAVKEAEPLQLSHWGQEELKEWMKRTNQELKGIRQDVISRDERVQQQVKEYKAASSVLTKVTSEKELIIGQKKTYQEKVKTFKTNMQEQYARWQQQFSEWNFETIEKAQVDIQKQDEQLQVVQQDIDRLQQVLDQEEHTIETLEKETLLLEQKQVEIKTTLHDLRASIATLVEKRAEILKHREIDPFVAMEALETEWETLKEKARLSEATLERVKQQRFESEKHYSNQRALYHQAQERQETTEKQLHQEMKKHGFESILAIQSAYLPDHEMMLLEEKINEYDKRYQYIEKEKERLGHLIGEVRFTEEMVTTLQTKVADLEVRRDQSYKEHAAFEKEWQAITLKHERFTVLEKEKDELEKLYSRLQKLQVVFRGNTFVEYIAEEQLIQISRMASDRLSHLTHGRYAIEVDTSGGFIIRDDANGGIRRPVSSLSGGETFLTSLALALSLSMQVQLRGEVPLQFFFLDEGFGTLDQELLDTVVTALEKLQTENMSIGVISHVPELRERLSKKIFVEPSEPSGIGSRIKYMV
ncbi:exonuclease SbcC [Pullulanibacillus pueri]|uniref:Nuclease SbcCD subunit C n=1 Tax=Pullulanibacillus pueri TaxID=1437324 RepID=A0A8J2ZYJ7_9BACL|nr:SbcC/MukB-like Walker B domain-containing protein [Pullulanibacillus pueri]MBM7680540.1 exonuclease SbcC [Pullulanibacillus pueri]GGH86163.1 nuclease SbcCD subunit C [Pullulanibacillus pueri]